MALRVTLLIKKLDSLTYEEFFNYWEGPHAEIFLNVPIVKKKVLKFSQFHIDKTISDGLTQSGLPMSEYDGEVNLWFASMSDFMEVIDMSQMFQDPEYRCLVVPDGDKFSKSKESRMMIGHDRDFIADGKML